MPERNDEAAYPEILEDLRSFLVADMQKMGLEQDSERIALAVTERLRNYWGGQQIYIPKGRFLDASNRDGEIEAQFDGMNRRKLSKRYQLSERHLYRIVDRVRAARRKKLSEEREPTLNIKTGGDNV